MAITPRDHSTPDDSGHYRIQQKLATSRRAVELSGGTAEQTAFLATAYAAAGQRAPAEEILGKLESRVMRGEIDPYYLAPAYLALGDRDKAIDALGRSVELGRVNNMNADVRLRSLRSDPRFIAMVERTRRPSDRE